MPAGVWLRPGEPATIHLRTNTHSGPALAVPAWSDLLIPSAEGTVVVRGVTRTRCTPPACVLQLVHPDERVFVSHERAGPLDWTLLTPPPAPQLQPGVPVTLELPIGSDDPRGPAADAVFVLEQRALITLAVHAPDLLATRPHLSLFGPSGPVQFRSATMGGKPDTFAGHFDLPPGTYRVRVLPQELECGEDPLPDWCRPPEENAREVSLVWSETTPLDPSAPLESGRPGLRLWETSCFAAGETWVPRPVPVIPAGAVLHQGAPILAAPEPTSASVTLAFAPGPDLALAWTPHDTPLDYRTGDGRTGSCYRSPCFLPHTASDRLTLSVENTAVAEDLVLTASLLPPPVPVTSLSPGKTVTLRTSAPADDPRGAHAEIVLKIPAPGEYQLQAHTAPGDEPSTLMLLAPDGGRAEYLSRYNARDGIRELPCRFEEAGRYRVRLDGCGEGHEIDVTVSLLPMTH